MSVERMLARQLAPWRDVLLAAPDAAALLRLVSLAFGTPYGGSYTDEGWLDYKGSYRGQETVRKPWLRYSSDSGETWTAYQGQALAALVRSILGSDTGSDAQADLFAGVA